MRNIKLTLAYDGTDFRGWQSQPDQPTVQGALAEILQRITQEAVDVQGAGRTDAGVHALGQVAHFHSASRMAPDEFLRALNSLLPAAIRVLAAEEAAADFHARHSALGKRYSYRIFRGAVLPPFLARYALHVPGALEEQAMHDAAQTFLGEHDFTTFSGNPDAGESPEGQNALPSTVRTIWEAAVERTGDDLIFRVHGRSFLRYMVRKMTGTLLEVGRDRLTPQDLRALLAARDRAQSGPTAPAHGLFLEAVEYPG